MRPEKRWMAVASRQGDHWTIGLPELVGETSRLFSRLQQRSKVGGVAGPLLRWIEDRGVTVQAGLVGYIEQGFSPGAEGEDQFDAFVGLLGMLDVIDRHRMDGAPDSHDIRNWEGWVFGQA